MRIVLITHFFPPHRTAGTENYAFGLAKAFLERGHEVNVVCAGEWDRGTDYWNGVIQDVYCDIPVYRLQLNWKRASNPNRALYFSSVIQDWLQQFLQEVQPDVVHVLSTYTLGVGALAAARRVGLPLILTLMDFWFLCPLTVLLRNDGELCSGSTSPRECQRCLLHSSGLFNRTARVLPEGLHTVFWESWGKIPALRQFEGAQGRALDMRERKKLMTQALSLPDILLTHSRFVRDRFAQVGVSARVHHLPNGHDLTWVNGGVAMSPCSMTRFGFIGQLTAVKGVDIAIRAFLLGRFADHARLDIWGDPDQEPEYANSLATLIGDNDSITLHGRFRREDLGNVLAEIDVLVVPSIWYENAPLAIYEAFASKTPVIAADLGGMAEAVTHEVNGLLFRPGQPEDLVQQMKRVVEDPRLLGTLRSGIPVVRSVGEEIAELEAIYSRLLIALPSYNTGE